MNQEIEYLEGEDIRKENDKEFVLDIRYEYFDESEEDEYEYEESEEEHEHEEEGMFSTMFDE